MWHFTLSVTGPVIARAASLATLAAAAMFALPHLAASQSSVHALQSTIAEIETRLDARVGVAILQTGTRWSWQHRADERVLMNSTFKALLCAAVLHRVEQGTLSLDETLPIRQTDIQRYAPVTQREIGNALTLRDLCFATIDQSDNTAANLLIDRLGGPQSVTAFLRGIGDTVGRLDRLEPALNELSADRLQDTTTPAAMASTLQHLLVGSGLSNASRQQLFDWMRLGGVTQYFLRAYVPDTWAVADKSGAGSSTRSLVAMLRPADDLPYFVAIYLADAEVSFAARNAALIKLSGAVVQVLMDRQASRQAP